MNTETPSPLALTPAEPDFELYTTSFKDVCKLNRVNHGRKLSDLVERVSQPMVIALDAPWGMGKTFFLKCWVGAHEHEFKKSGKTLYFDAFKYDFMDDPLVGLTRELISRFQGDETKDELVSKIKSAIPKIGRGVLKIALRAATAATAGLIDAQAASNAIEEAAKAAINETGEQISDATKEFWQEETNRYTAMEEFRAALTELAKDEKLILVVDELDRCRPDYALQLLEVIKHFFNVPNVHFVLGVNMEQLATSVRARYGDKTPAEKYLQKFITVTMPLNARRDRYQSNREAIEYMENIYQDTNEKQIGIFVLKQYLSSFHDFKNISLRDAEKISSLALVTPLPTNSRGRVISEYDVHLFCGLLFMKVLEPDMFEKAKQGKLGNDFLDLIDMSKDWDSINGIDSYGRNLWELISGESLTTEQIASATYENKTNYNPHKRLKEIAIDCFGTFELPS